MSISLPLADPENFDEVNHQGKRIKVGDRVVVHQAGEERVVEVSSISKKWGHYWVGYDDDNLDWQMGDRPARTSRSRSFPVRPGIGRCSQQAAAWPASISPRGGSIPAHGSSSHRMPSPRKSGLRPSR